MSGLPLLVARGESIPEAWENSVLELHRNGQWYKRDDPEDNDLQLDASMAIEIQNPDADLFLHKSVTCGFEDLFDYMMELHGARDSLIKDLDNPEDHKWDYLYSERLNFYPTSNGSIDQIEKMVEKLSARPFTRRANSTLWVPERDAEAKDTPCLQRIGFLITPDGKEKGLNRLNMTYNFRTRNVMIAAPMNIIGFYSLMCGVRDKVRKNTGMNLENGRMLDVTDTYHVSSRDQKILNGFVERHEVSRKKGEGIESRAYTKDFALNYMSGIRQERTDGIISQLENTFQNRINAVSDSTKKDAYNERLESEKIKVKALSSYLGEKIDRGFKSI